MGKTKKAKHRWSNLIDVTVSGECKPNINEFENLSLVKIDVNLAPLILSIDTVVMRKILSNPLWNLEL